MRQAIRRQLALLLATGLLASAVVCADRAVEAERHMVSAANPHAAEAGLAILRAGGSAVDAAIAVQLVLSLVEPQSSGVGGGAFMLYYDATADGIGPSRVTFYDGRETAPAAATPDMYLEPDGSPAGFFAVGTGGPAVGVPGVMRLLEQAHSEHGRLPWEALFAPAITLAEDGFEISPRLHGLLQRFAGLARVPAFRDYFYDDEGAPLPVGHRLANPDYAATLRLLAAEGVEPMYTGTLARDIVSVVRDNDVAAGRLTMDDLADYRIRRLAPLCTGFRAWQVCGPQPPSSGGITVQQILSLVELLDAPSLREDAVSALHLLAEASRLAFADRNLYLADTDFVEVPVAGLLSAPYLRERAALVARDRAMSEVQAGTPPRITAREHAAASPHDMMSTSHFSIVDGWGSAVSMTTTVQSAFGSQLMVGGFLLNNQLTDFSFVPEIDGLPVANRVEPGKRPLSSMAPSLAFDADGRLSLVIGSPGGTRIIGFVAQTLLGVLHWGMDVQQAISAPRVIAQLGPVELEEGTELAAQADALRALGHRVTVREINSGLHGIEIRYQDGGTRLVGGADPRREGVVLGD
jgi:gamma-glutamyltranspeptidase / glutathione hydrolase